MVITQKNEGLGLIKNKLKGLWLVNNKNKSLWLVTCCPLPDLLPAHEEKPMPLSPDLLPAQELREKRHFVFIRNHSFYLNPACLCRDLFSYCLNLNLWRIILKVIFRRWACFRFNDLTFQHSGTIIFYFNLKLKTLLSSWRSF